MKIGSVPLRDPRFYIDAEGIPVGTNHIRISQANHRLVGPTC